jgi:hypothetical protein
MRAKVIILSPLLLKSVLANRRAIGSKIWTDKSVGSISLTLLIGFLSYSGLFMSGPSADAPKPIHGE